jgi:hypothetical protein
LQFWRNRFSHRCTSQSTIAFFAMCVAEALRHTPLTAPARCEPWHLASITKRLVERRVFSTGRKHSEVLRAVVIFDEVDVMDNLFRSQRSPDGLFSYKDASIDIATGVRSWMLRTIHAHVTAPVSLWTAHPFLCVCAGILQRLHFIGARSRACWVRSWADSLTLKITSADGTNALNHSAILSNRCG